jgi:isochorismate synthase EntC
MCLQVVLGRASSFTFPCGVRPLEIVSRLRSHYGYLFCFQLDDQRAFLGCTPEQLFKVGSTRGVRKGCRFEGKG